jgi:hypothetical protein
MWKPLLERMNSTAITSTFEARLSDGQIGLAELRLALKETLEAGLVSREVTQLVLSHALASLGRALCLGCCPEAGIEYMAEAMDAHPSCGPNTFQDLLIRQAEEASAHGQSQEAIHRWQDIAVLMGERTPDFVYRELSNAYAESREGFGGSPEENQCWGDCHKHDVLAFLHGALKPQLYLEIGVDEGLSLARAPGPAMGIDPRPELNLKSQLPDSARIIPLSSDAFFRDGANQLVLDPPELIFIDGMHLFEFVLRDFMAVERYASPHSLVVIDDIYPCHPVQAARRRRSSAWTGDVWKFHQILQRERPDLTLLALNADTTGLLLIAGLNPQDRHLQSVYTGLVREFRPICDVPEAALARHGAIPSSHPVLADLVRHLNRAKDEQWSVKEVQTALRPVREKTQQVGAGFQAFSAATIGSCDLAGLAAEPSDDQPSELRA